MLNVWGHWQQWLLNPPAGSAECEHQGPACTKQGDSAKPWNLLWASTAKKP